MGDRNDNEENPHIHVYGKRGWSPPKRPREAEPDHPRWERDTYFRSPDGMHKALAILMDSPVMQQRIRDWLIINFDDRSVTQWVQDLINRELPDEHWNFRDGYDPKVLLKPDVID